MASVTLQSINKTYPGGVVAVESLDLTIQDGEFLVLVGPSGCGKSTTLRMIAGLESITAGDLKIGDRTVNSVHPRDRDIAMVFQNYALYPHMTVRKNLAFALKMRKTPKAKIAEQVEWAANLLDLVPLLDRKPGALSGGQRQRVALGRAIVRQPQVFLFDEPLSNLDAKLRVAMRAEMKRLHHELKTTTIYVTHDQEEAMTLGDRVAVMHNGRLQQCDAPLEVYNRPVNQFVASFLGTPPMNLIRGEIKSAGEGVVFSCSLGTLQLPSRAGELSKSDLPLRVVAGIRPEALSFADESTDESTKHALAATVQLTEPLGSTMDVYLKSDDRQTLVCRAPASELAEDTPVQLQVSPADVHLFSADEAGTRL